MRMVANANCVGGTPQMPPLWIDPGTDVPLFVWRRVWGLCCPSSKWVIWRSTSAESSPCRPQTGQSTASSSGFHRRSFNVYRSPPPSACPLPINFIAE